MITEQWNVYTLEKDYSSKADTLSPTLEAWIRKLKSGTEAICCAWKPVSIDRTRKPLQSQAPELEDAPIPW